MKIEIIPCLSDNYSYLIFEKLTNTVSIVDPSEFGACEKAIKNKKKTNRAVGPGNLTRPKRGFLTTYRAEK